MQLNRNRSFATIVGHEWARYEQDGVLFDGQGNTPASTAAIAKAAKPNSKSAPKTDVDLKVRNAQDFLKALLAGGPIDKSVVFKEAENNCQDWESVKVAFAKLNGASFKRGQSTIWRLTEDIT
jgi:hypothetical protein